MIAGFTFGRRGESSPAGTGLRTSRCPTTPGSLPTRLGSGRCGLPPARNTNLRRMVRFHRWKNIETGVSLDGQHGLVYLSLLAVYIPITHGVVVIEYRLSERCADLRVRQRVVVGQVFGSRGLAHAASPLYRVTARRRRAALRPLLVSVLAGATEAPEISEYWTEKCAATCSVLYPERVATAWALQDLNPRHLGPKPSALSKLS